MTEKGCSGLLKAAVLPSCPLQALQTVGAFVNGKIGRAFALWSFLSSKPLQADSHMKLARSVSRDLATGTRGCD